MVSTWPSACLHAHICSPDPLPSRPSLISKVESSDLKLGQTNITWGLVQVCRKVSHVRRAWLKEALVELGTYRKQGNTYPEWSDHKLLFLSFCPYMSSIPQGPPLVCNKDKHLIHLRQRLIIL